MAGYSVGQERGADMQASAQHEGTNPVNAAKLEAVLQQVAEHKGCGTHGGSGKASCGSAAGQGDLPAEIWEKVKNHPCYSEEAHHHYARQHATFNAITATANMIAPMNRGRAW